jgi:hypothetical protein
LDSRLDEREKKKKKKEKPKDIYLYVCCCVIFKESVGVARIVHVETGYSSKNFRMKGGELSVMCICKYVFAFFFGILTN